MLALKAAPAVQPAEASGAARSSTSMDVDEEAAGKGGQWLFLLTEQERKSARFLIFAQQVLGTVVQSRQET